MELPAIAAHATERAGGPRLARGANKKFFLPALLEECVIGGRKVKRLRRGQGSQTGNRQTQRKPNRKAPSDKPRRLREEWFGTWSLRLPRSLGLEIWSFAIARALRSTPAERATVARALTAHLLVSWTFLAT